MKEWKPMSYDEKSKLAIECMDALLCVRGDEAKKIIDYWSSKTIKPFDKEEFYRSVEASIAHLRKPIHSWDENFSQEGSNE